MSTGLEMFDALCRRVKDLRPGESLHINVMDTLDLLKLKTSDLASRGFDEVTAEKIAKDLFRGTLGELSKALGVTLRAERDARGLIPGEGLRRAGGALADDGQSMEEMLRELDAIRHPERYAG